MEFEKVLKEFKEKYGYKKFSKKVIQIMKIAFDQLNQSPSSIKRKGIYCDTSNSVEQGS